MSSDLPRQRETPSPEAVPFLDLGPSERRVRAALDAAWSEALRSGEYVGGAAVADFEEAWAAYCGVGHAVGVGNGTDAIELALRALGVGPGDEVVVPANTFIATAHAVVSTGARVVFADVDASSLLLTAEGVQRVVSPRTRAVVAVHLFGNAVDLDELLLLTRALGIALLEDCAQAHGARWRGQAVGSLGDAGCFSFYPSKNLGALGDGGAVVTSDPRLAAAVRQMADHGRSAADRWMHAVAGRNSRLDALQARVLSAKLPHLDRWNDERRSAHSEYRRRLAGAPGVQLQLAPPGSTSVHHLAVVQVDDRARVQAELAEQGIGTGVHYPVPCHLQPSLREPGREAAHLPVVEAASRRIVSLPMYPGITSGAVARVCSALSGAAARHAGEESLRAVGRG